MTKILSFTLKVTNFFVGIENEQNGQWVDSVVGLGTVDIASTLEIMVNFSNGVVELYSRLNNL